MFGFGPIATLPIAAQPATAGALPAAPAVAVGVVLQSRAGVLAANLAGLRYALFVQTAVHTLAAPILAGSNGSSSGAGVLTLDVSALGLVVGQTLLLALSSADGTNTFIGPVVAG